MVLEYEGAIKKLQKEFVEGMVKLFVVWTNYFKFANPLNMPSFTNEEGAEALLQLYFKQSDDSIYEYLKTTKTYLPQSSITDPTRSP